MTRFDSVVVGNDLVSEHWLAEQFPATVKALRAALEGAGGPRQDHPALRSPRARDAR